MFNQKVLLAAAVSLSLISCSTAGGEPEASVEVDATKAQTSTQSETTLGQSDTSNDSPTSTTVSSSTTGTVVVSSELTTSQDNAGNVRGPETATPAPQTAPETVDPAPQTTPDPNGYEAFRVRTYAQVQEHGRVSLEKDFIGEFVLQFSPGFDPEKAKRLTADIKNAFKPWQSLTASRGIKVVVADENGSEFFLDQMPPNSNCPGTVGHRAFDPPQPGSHMGFVCWNPSGSYIMYLGLHSTDDGWGSSFIHHEVTHLAQAGITPKHIDGQPCVYFEGEAQFFGSALSSPPPRAGDPHPASHSLRAISEKYEISSLDDWVDLLLSRESRASKDCYKDQFHYQVGWIVVERAYGEFGAAKWDLWRASLDGRDWRQSFLTIFGVEPTDWYRDSLVPYLKHWCKC
jgi:hypothetical protein